MPKVESLQALRELKEQFRPKVQLRKIESQDTLPATPKGIYSRHILVCGGTGCKASKSDDILKNFKTILEEKNLKDVLVLAVGCFGFCERGPIVKILPDNTFYTQVKPEDVATIIDEHIIGGNAVKKLLYTDPITLDHVTDFREIEFYKKQKRIALRNCGLINPEDIEECIACDGYQALGRCLEEMTPQQVIQIIKDSGLRGRGGAGFPTGLKWEITSKSVSDQKYVVCNADEGDPGAFMDRSILEGDPNSILEAMAICGYAIGANKGLIYIRAEYPLAIHRLQVAIQQARETGLLGKNILGKNFDFDIEIRYGAGAFVCGEETALIHSMEGQRGEPTLRPPYPSVSGYFGQPTNVNNVETLANVPAIINEGAAWFASIGTEKSKGTKVFALAGKINNVGLIEVPQGITLREIIYEIGGGIKDGKKFKAVQTGGPSGGCLTEAHLDIPIDYENLVAAGSMMGSGGMIVMDEDDCMVSIAKFYLEFTVEESCGKCAPCRVGNKRLLEILGSITEGNGTPEDLERLKDLSYVIKDTALCGLGQTSPNPVLSTLQHFHDEYMEHVKDKRCRSRQCHLKQRYKINEEKCVGCTACVKACPVGAITGEKKKPHFLHEELCIRCGACYAKCKFEAIDIL